MIAAPQNQAMHPSTRSGVFYIVALLARAG